MNHERILCVNVKETELIHTPIENLKTTTGIKPKWLVEHGINYVGVIENTNHETSRR